MLAVRDHSHGVVELSRIRRSSRKVVISPDTCRQFGVHPEFRKNETRMCTLHSFQVAMYIANFNAITQYGMPPCPYDSFRLISTSDCTQVPHVRSISFVQ
jgi:hypothetical protein